MAINTKNRTELKSYFVKNAIPTQGNFADLIDSHLNQTDDGVFKLTGEALSVVAGAGAQQQALRLYAGYPAPNPDWLISLSPSDPSDGTTPRPGFGIVEGTGKTRLSLDADGVLICDTAGTAGTLRSAGRMHIAGGELCFLLHKNGVIIGKEWGGTGDLRVEGNIAVDGKQNVGGYGPTTAYVNAPTMEVGGQDPSSNGARGGILYLHDHGRIAHQLRYSNGTLYLEGAGNGYGTNATPTLAVGGDISIGGKHALRGNDTWLRLNQDGAFGSGVYTPGHLRADGDIQLSGKSALRGDDTWLRLNQDGAFVGVYTPGLFRVDGEIRVAGNIGTRGNDPTGVVTTLPIGQVAYTPGTWLPRPPSDMPSSRNGRRFKRRPTFARSLTRSPRWRS
jgi:hypothetical protein